MKKTKAVLLTLFCALLLTAAAPSGVWAGLGRMPRFIDETGLLTDSQAANLTAKLNEVSEYRQFDVVVAVVPALDHREARLFAADFFEENGFGYGSDIDGAILLLAMQDRDYGFASFGYGLYVFTETGQDFLIKRFLPQLKEDDYYGAFMAFAEAVDDFVGKADEGAPYDKGNIPLLDYERQAYRRNTIIFSLVVPLLAALIVTGRWKGQLKSVRKQNLAHAYIKEDSMNLAVQRDIFLHRRVTKVKIASESSSSGGSGFKSSSGRSSTGRSGKF